jgi:GR25 family glycosyltransferase involved in LPS biosynthesis
MRLDKIYILAVNIDQNKVDNILNRLQELGTDRVPYEIFEGFNGYLNPIPEGMSIYDNWAIPDSWNTWWKNPLHSGEIGCSIAHYLLWKKIKAEGFERVLILEEDFKVLKPINEIKEVELELVEWDMLYLGRYAFDDGLTKSISDNLAIPGLSYCNHAYVLTQNGINHLIDGGLQNNIIPIDEYVPAMYIEHRRPDIAKIFPPRMKAISTKVDFVGQSSNGNTENELLKLNQHDNDMKTYNYAILDDSDWNLWKSKYIDKVMARGEYDLLVDEVGPRYSNIFEFPLFPQLFCDELIAMAEAENKWTEGRHEFYPTNDVLLNELGLGDIYKRVIREIVTPLATHIWKLEGAWLTNPSEETFMIKYSMDKQGHLSLHHDHSYFTCGVRLNDEFEGGGTYFPRYGVCVTPKRNGNAFLHPGAITHKHGARPIHAGIRYIIVSFIRP